MRWLSSLLVAVVLVAACSSKSSVDVIREDAGSGGGSNAGGSGGGTNTGGSGDTGGSGGSSGNDGGAGDASVTTGPLSFDPSSLTLRGGESADVRLVFQPDDSFTGTLEVALDGAPPSGGVGSKPTIEPEAVLLSSSVREQSVTIRTDADLPQGRYTVRASGAPSAGGEPLLAELALTISGAPGQLDLGLGDGRGYFDFQPDGACSAEGVVALSDGRFVITGQALTSYMMIARFNEDGTPDTSFGPDGSGVLIDPQRQFVRSAPVLLDDGSLLVAFDQGFISVARVRDDGTLDPEWGTGGVLDTDLRAANHVAFAVDDRGRLLIGGSILDSATNQLVAVVRRLLADGSLDASFASDGTVELPLGGNGPALPVNGSLGYVEDLVTLSNGNIVVTGSCYVDEGFPNAGDNHFVARIQSNGQMDSSFASQGVAITKIGANEFGNFEASYSAAVQALEANTGKTVAAGYYRQNADTPYLMSLFRYLPNGTTEPLPSQMSTLDVPDNTEDYPGRLLLEEDDGIVTHIASYGATNFVVLRLAPDLALDPAWGSGGIGTTVPGRALGMARSGSRLIVVGTAQPAPDAPQQARIARYWLR